MTLLPLLHQSKDLLAPLGESALRSLAVAAIAALALALLRSGRATARLQVWTSVLYVALAMPLLSIFMPHLNVAIPGVTWLAAHTTHSTASPTEAPNTAPDAYRPSPAANFAGEHAVGAVPKTHATQPQTGTKAAVSDLKSHTASVDTRAVPAQRASSVNWAGIALGIYLLGLVILLARLLLGMRGSRRLAATAGDISPRYFPRKGEVEDAYKSAALDFLALQSQRAGVKIAPHLKESPALLVPATVGIRRPLILLPEDWREWSREKLEAVLAHEISHVARRDAVTQLLSKVHCAFFWFSPLPWWLDWKITDLAEQASDEAALTGGADRTLYAETLLGFFSQVEGVHRRVRWHALSLSMASHGSSGHAERRVDRILAWRAATSMKKSLVVILVSCAAPVIFLVASLRPSVTAHAQPETGRTVAAVPTSKPVALRSSASPATQPSLMAQAATPIAEKSTQQKDGQSSEESNTININGGSYNSRSGPRYVIIHANSNSVTMSGDQEDLQHARSLRGKINGDFIWFERDEKSYVITDPAFLDRVKTLFAPQEELEKQQDALGRQQDDLGRQQDELGRQQDELGKQMDAVSVKVPDISPDLERIHARLKQLQASGATQSELGSVQAEIGELQSRLGHLQSEAGQQQSVVGRQQSDLGRKQGELGQRQGELGRQQGELGRRQGELARKASSELRRMFDDAITKGIAKPE